VQRCSSRRPNEDHGRDQISAQVPSFDRDERRQPERDRQVERDPDGGNQQPAGAEEEQQGGAAERYPVSDPPSRELEEEPRAQQLEGDQDEPKDRDVGPEQRKHRPVDEKRDEIQAPVVGREQRLG